MRLFRRLDWAARAGKWVAHASRFKAEVLARPAERRSQLRYEVWDGWGALGMDTDVYLVFDPHERLLVASHSHLPGKPSGLACAVQRVERMEPHWYSIVFYTEQAWNFCGSALAQ